VRRWILPWLPPVVWAATLFSASLLPGPSLPTVEIPAYDKIVHVALYAVLGALCFRALRRTTALLPIRAALFAAALATAYGVSDEVHQLWIPTRYADWRDAIADAVGALLGSFLFLRLSRCGRQGRKPRPDPVSRAHGSNSEAAL